MTRRTMVWLGVLALALAARAGAVEYAADTVYDDPIEVGSGSETLRIHYDHDVEPATQAGDITSATNSARLYVTGQSGSLILAGDNTGYIGTVSHANGTLVFSQNRNLFGLMSGYVFDGSLFEMEYAAILTAVTDYISSNPTKTWQDIVEAVDDAREAAVLPTFTVAAGSAVVIDGQDTDDQRMVIWNGSAGSFHLEDGASLSFRDSDYSGGGNGGALYVGSSGLLAFTAGDGALYDFTGNTADNGGAIYNNSGTVILTDVSFTQNTASGS